MSFFKNDQQYNFLVLLSSIIGLWLSGKWIIHEIKFVSIKLDFDLDISWGVQAPLMFFIAIIFLVSLLLFFSSIKICEPKELITNVPWKRSLIIALIFNIVIALAVFINTYLQIKNYDFAAMFVFMVLFFLYIYGAKEHGINPIFFLVIVLIISAIFWKILFLLF